MLTDPNLHLLKKVLHGIMYDVRKNKMAEEEIDAGSREGLKSIGCEELEG